MGQSRRTFKTLVCGLFRDKPCPVIESASRIAHRPKRTPSHDAVNLDTRAVSHRGCHERVRDTPTRTNILKLAIPGTNIGDNVRDDAALSKEFLASIAENGVLNPLTAVRGDDGVVRI